MLYKLSIKKVQLLGVVFHLIEAYCDTSDQRQVNARRDSDVVRLFVLESLPGVENLARDGSDRPVTQHD